MEIISIFEGESLTINIVISEPYNMARLKSHQLYIGARAVTGDVSGNTILAQLPSEYTHLLLGLQPVTLWMDDLLLGVRKTYVGDVLVRQTNAREHNGSVSEVHDVVIPVTVTETTITVDDMMYNYMKGDSAYQVWLDAGNVGTEADFFAYLQQPAADMIANLNETNEAALTAEGLRATAETTRIQNEQGRVTAEGIRVTAETARQTNTATAILNAENATALATEVAEHPDTIINDYWWKWNTKTNAYENTNIMAKGGVYYPVFELNPDDGLLTLTADSDYTNTTFEINETDGTLILNINM